VLELLQRDAKLGFAIEGHTDTQGDRTNGPLSKLRAEAVKMWLAKQGSDASRLVSGGLGDTKPIDTKSTAAGRANTRRAWFMRREV
jgi:OOP family OmpA-OmpF porin